MPILRVLVEDKNQRDEWVVSSSLDLCLQFAMPVTSMLVVIYPVGFATNDVG
jgi:hypothetical protein